MSGPTFALIVKMKLPSIARRQFKITNLNHIIKSFLFLPGGAALRGRPREEWDSIVAIVPDLGVGQFPGVAPDNREDFPL
jgi:hypothetical protein